MRMLNPSCRHGINIMASYRAKKMFIFMWFFHWYGFGMVPGLNLCIYLGQNFPCIRGCRLALAVPFFRIVHYAICIKLMEIYAYTINTKSRNYTTGWPSKIKLHFQIWNIFSWYFWTLTIKIRAYSTCSLKWRWPMDLLF